MALALIVDLLRLLRLTFRSRARLAAENLFLRKQLACYVERKVRPRERTMRRVSHSFCCPDSSRRSTPRLPLRTARGLSFCGAQPSVGPFPRNQLAMPSKNRICGDKRRHVSQYSASQMLPSIARRRRCPSFNCSRRPDNCDFSVRFSSRRNAITSRCSRSSHPSNAVRSICNGLTE